MLDEYGYPVELRMTERREALELAAGKMSKETYRSEKKRRVLVVSPGAILPDMGDEVEVRVMTKEARE